MRDEAMTDETTKFERAKESLKALEQQDNLTIYDALNVFYDLCEDIRTATGAVDKLPAGNDEQVVGRLCWAGRMLLKISDKHPEIIENTRKAQNWESISIQLKDVDGQLEDLIESGNNLNQQYEELCRKKAHVIECVENETKMWEKCMALTQDIQTYENQRHPEVEKQLEMVNEQFNLSKQLYEQKQQEVQKGKARQTVIEHQIQAQIEEIKQQQELFEQQQAQLQKLLEDAEKTLEKVQTENAQLQKRIDNAAMQKNNLLQRRQGTQEELKALEDWFGSLEVKQYKERLEICQHRAQVLKNARDKLFKDMNIFAGMANAPALQQLSASQRYFKDTMEHIERFLNEYQKNYLLVTRIFEAGGSSL